MENTNKYKLMQRGKFQNHSATLICPLDAALYDGTPQKNRSRNNKTCIAHLLKSEAMNEIVKKNCVTYRYRSLAKKLWSWLYVYKLKPITSNALSLYGKIHTPFKQIIQDTQLYPTTSVNWPLCKH